MASRVDPPMPLSVHLLCNPQLPAHWPLPTINTICFLCLKVFPDLFLHRHLQFGSSGEPTLPGTTGSALMADVSHWVRAQGSLSSSGQLWDGSMQLLRGSWVRLRPRCPWSNLLANTHIVGFSLCSVSFFSFPTPAHWDPLQVGHLPPNPCLRACC